MGITALNSSELISKIPCSEPGSVIDKEVQRRGRLREHAWKGELWVGSDYCLVNGQTGHTQPHAHYAHQVLIAREGKVQAMIQGQIQHGAVLLVESNQQHAILESEQPSITLFAEPLAFDLEALRHVCLQCGPDLERLIESMRRLKRRRLDPRLGKALERIRELDDEALPAGILAREAAISISQLERLFSGTLGLSVCRLVLWQRLRHALLLALSGYNLTTAASAAGFSDSAHLSRSVRRQFGIRSDLSLRHLKLRVLD